MLDAMGTPRRLVLLVLALGVAGCRGASSTPPGGAVASSNVSPVVTSQGLSLSFEIRPEVRMDRVPLRTVALRFRNTSNAPIRIYLPRSEPFRAGLSTIFFSAGGAQFSEPEPRPHGYAITEIDFPLLAPGEEQVFEQTFTLDPMVPGPGTKTARRPGFESGVSAKVRWVYENKLVRWPGGAKTLDGPSNTLFGGGDIPHIWTGTLTVESGWVVPLARVTVSSVNYFGHEAGKQPGSLSHTLRPPPAAY